MIFSNSASGETVDFKLYDSETDQIIDLNETLGFASDMTVGNGFAPFSLTGEVSSGGGGDACDADPAEWSVNQMLINIMVQ